MKLPTVEHAKLIWDDQGTPVSREFDDIYFSTQNGPEETRYVFLHGNHLPERFCSHPRPLFIVAETGFGTGLNFLTLCHQFTAFHQSEPDAPLQRLHFISSEKYPVTMPDLVTAHAHWPQLAPWAEQLRQQWPAALAGCHRLLLDHGRITLDLWFGDINNLLTELDDSLQQQVDAWFLDGFAPAKNPAMWSQAVFQKMAQLTRPGGTFATFTAAGFVRRGLQTAGFNVSKCQGFGQKREMLTGTLITAQAHSSDAPWYARQSAQGDDYVIIGGGIASALLALSLLRRGKKATVYCADDAPAQGASGNRQGALYPVINPQDTTLTHFFPIAFTFARRLYDLLPITFEHDWCGVMQLAWNEKNAAKITAMAAMELPVTLARATTSHQAEELCGIHTGCGGLYYPAGGWVSPAELTIALFELAQQQGLQIHWQHSLITITRQQHHWRLRFTSGTETTCTNVVLANGHHIGDFPQTAHLPLSPVGGQVSHVPSTATLSLLKTVLCYDGYFTPKSPQWNTHCIGASHRREDAAVDYREIDQQNNYKRLLHCLPESKLAAEINTRSDEARCSVRCASRDHLPMAGNVPDYVQTRQQYTHLQKAVETGQPVLPAPVWPGLFMLGALGSRGLCSAPLAAEVLAAQMCNEPIPLDKTTLAALNPNRYWIRRLLKGRPLKPVHPAVSGNDNASIP